MHPLVKLAKETIEQYIQNGRVLKQPSEKIPEMDEKAGVFVSLKKKGALRGCIGTFQSTTENVAKEIIQNAISAAVHDPRFSPVRVQELNDLVYSVDVLSEPEKIESKKELDPQKYGVIVVRGNSKGLLLPALEGVDTAEQQINIACMKAGISPDEDIELYRFEVKRYK